MASQPAIDADAPADPEALLELRDDLSWQLFLERYIATIDRAVTGCCRDAEEGADIAAEVLAKLAADWPEILRRFCQRSSEATFTPWLAVVARRAAIDVLRSRHGRWEAPRPVQRLPRWERRLHALVHRDGHDLPAAAELLRAEGLFSGDGATLAAAAWRVAGMTPAGARTPRPRVLSVAPTDEGVAGGSGLPIEPVAADHGDREGHLTESHARLAGLLEFLPETDRVLLRLYFLEGFSANDLLAVTGGRTRSQVYNRIHAVTGKLRELAEERGLTPEDLPAAGHIDWHALLAERPENDS